MSTAMRRNTLLADERRRLIAERLRRNGSVSVAALEEEFAISAMTARRDLDALERGGVARRTHGGAVLPGLASHEDSFLQRLDIEVDAKERLADAALALIEPGQALFVDSSTTAYFVARRIVRQNVRCTLLTNAVAILGLVSEVDAPQVDVIGVGGALRKRTRSLVGPEAVRGVEAHFADQVLFSVRGITADGHLTDPDALEAEVKHAMVRRAERAVLLADGTKFGRAALTRIAPASDVSVLLSADAPADALAALERAGVEVRRV
jgi:DeoR/GlpR family transcriptional regulator of sugar metabolism